MKAMILAAGLGTRLKPLTAKRPKPLMPVANRPVIDRLIAYLKEHGVQEIVVNAHHHQEQMVAHLDEGRPFGIPIELSLEPEILGTGGGIKKVENFWDETPFVVVNGDILTDIDIRAAYAAHIQEGNMVTMVVHDREPFNQIAVDAHMNITDISDQNLTQRLAFTGIHIMEADVLTYIPESGFSNIIDCYRTLIRRGKPVRAWRSAGHYWRDIGTVKSYVAANQEFLHNRKVLVGPGSRISDSALIEEWAVMGRDTTLEDGVEIRRAILWEGVWVKRGVKVIDSIVTDHQEVKNRDLIQEIR